MSGAAYTAVKIVIPYDNYVGYTGHYIKYAQRNVTLSATISYLRPTTHSKSLTAVGREVKVGGHIGFFEVDITDDSGALIARAEVNMYFLDH